MSFLDRIRECNRRDMRRYRPFLVGETQAGWVRDDMAAALAPHGDVFIVAAGSVTLAPLLTNFAGRSAAVDRVLRGLAGGGLMTAWRDEPFPVAESFAAAPLFVMERAAVPLFGVRAFGVHMNGFVRRRDGLHMWIARRAMHKPTYPGLLDNMVAGGQPYGLSPKANLIKECREEAGMPSDLADRAVAVGAITYCAETSEGLRPDAQFCYDLELPADFVPRPHDDEIESFTLLPIADVAAIVRDTQQFKFNCNLVIIDFLIRHGLIAPDDPDYLAIVQGLHS